jgi:predicted MFS family arabinose efflux permease
MAVWLRLAVAGAATLMVGMGLGRFSYGPLVPALIRSDALSVAEAGYVGAFNLAGYLVGALVTPAVRERFREAAILKFCLWSSLACLAASIAPWGFAWLAFWRFLVGCTVAVMMIGALALVTRSAPVERLGRATGIVFTGVGVGILFAGSMVPILLRDGLATAWGGLAALGAVGVMIGHWGWSAADAPPAPAPSGRAPLTPGITRLVVGQGMFSIGMVPYSIYGVDYAVRGLGHDIGFGGFLWALFGLGALTGTMLWGRLADRIGFSAGLSAVFAVLAIALVMPVTWVAPVVLVISFYVFGTQPGVSAIASSRAHQIVGPGHMPFVWRWMVLAGGVGQVVGGYGLVAVYNATGDHTRVFLIGAAAMACGSLLALPFWTRRTAR